MTVPIRFVFLLYAFSFTALLSAQPLSKITFSEVMFRTNSSDNSEFIEVYNLSDRDTVNLSGFNFKYYTSSADKIMPYSDGDSLLLPGRYAVIFENDYDRQAGVYAGEIGRDALVMRIDDGAFGSSGMANSSDRMILLMNANGDTVDVYTYTADNSANFSDEKVFLNSDNSDANWKNSVREFGTPGYKNSVSPKNYNLSIADFSILPAIPLEGDTLFAKLKVKNIGTQDAVNFKVRIFNDADLDTSLNASEVILDEFVAGLQSGDSLMYSARIDSIEIIKYLIAAKVDFPEDELPKDNLSVIEFNGETRSADFGDVLVNEFMYLPLKGEPEWVEIFNRSKKTLDLSGWQIRDKSSGTLLPGEEILLRPKEYLVLTKNDLIERIYGVTSKMLEISVPSLNNTGDQIKIVDEKGLTIDSLEFTRNWGGRYGGRSLERIDIELPSADSTNWKTCQSPARATPGRINSVTQKEFDISVAGFFSSSSELNAGDTVRLAVNIKNSGIKAADFSLQLFEDTDLDSVRNLLREQSADYSLIPGDSLQYQFNYQVEGIFKPRGYYVEINCSSDQNELNNSAYLKLIPRYPPGSLLINELMTVPHDGEPEWIEVVNHSKNKINLSGWSISDRSSTTTIKKEAQLQPNDYLIIAKDSSVNDYFSIPSSTIEIQLPSLNNYDDDITITDAMGENIDSLSYHSSWGGANGVSLERISLNVPTNDPDNWGSSKSEFGATPGRLNSLSKKDFDVSVIQLSAAPEFPLPDESVKFTVRAANIGKFNVDFSAELWTDADGNGAADSLIAASGSIPISAGDTIDYEFQSQFSGLTAGRIFSAVLKASQDNDTTNNIASEFVRPIFPARSIVINEIMYNSDEGEPEWIEFFNNSDYTINLSGWLIRDVVTTPAQSEIDTNFVLSPRKYLLIAKDSAVFNYHRVIPAAVLFNSFPNLNNDEDGIVLRDFTGRTMDSVWYGESFDLKSGKSLERIYADGSSNSPLNWRSSLDAEAGTPGRINSVTPKNHDLAAVKIQTVPEFPVPGEEVKLALKVKNNGLSDAGDFSVKFYLGGGVSKVLFESIDGLSLQSEETLTVITQTETIIETKLHISAQILFAADEDSLNNYAEAEIFSGFGKRELVINEVMIDPPEGESEWVEIMNISEDSVNLSGCSVSDVSPAGESGLITDRNIFLPPEGYLLIAHDSSLVRRRDISNAEFLISNFGALGNNGDGIVIRDFRGAVVDSFSFSNNWGLKKRRSLERISIDGNSTDSLNWTASINPQGATPGIENSVSSIASAQFNSAVINEIMYEPVSGAAEFIEIYNPRQSAIDIGGWSFIESAGTPMELSAVTYILEPGGFFIIANDSSILSAYPELQNNKNCAVFGGGFTLTNSGEAVQISDVFGNTVDSVNYQPDWHNPNILSASGKSLERLSPLVASNDPSNWSTCAAESGATPGSENSIFINNVSASSNFEISPNPFSPDGDGFEDFTSINYNLAFPIARMRIRVFDSRGRKVRTLENNLLSGAKGSVIFDGFSDSRRPLKMGIYILLIDVIDSSSGIMHTFKKAVVVARKLG